MNDFPLTPVEFAELDRQVLRVITTLMTVTEPTQATSEQTWAETPRNLYLQFVNDYAKLWPSIATLIGALLLLKAWIRPLDSE